MKAASYEVSTRNKFIGLPDGNILSWCPVMDLLAVSMNRTSIWVFRLNGERIYSINNRSEILDISWQNDGKFFCLSGVDGRYKIYDSENGTLINEVGKEGNKLVLIGTSKHEVKEDSNDVKELFRVDIFGNLARISSTAEVSKDIPSSLVDEINEHNHKNLTFVFSINDRSSMQITINQHFTIEDIELPNWLHFISYSSNEGLNSGFYLAKSDRDSCMNLVEVGIEIPKSFNYGFNMSMLLSNASKLVSMMSLFKSILLCINEEVKPYIKMLDRQLSNLVDLLYTEEDLMQCYPTNAEREDKTRNCLYDILLTGLIPINLKDYWINQFGERIFKRLDKTGNAIYERIRKVVFEFLVQLLERFLIMFNSSRGYFRWFEILNKSTKIQGCMVMDLEKLDAIITGAQNLMKLLYDLIWSISEEQEMFNKFLSWIKLQIIEKIEKEDDLESYYDSFDPDYKVSEIMKYLKSHLFSSTLLDYFRVDTADNEIIISEHPKKDILGHFERLEAHILQDYLEVISSSTRNSFKVKKCVSLDMEASDEAKINTFSSFISISNLTENKTSLKFLFYEKEGLNAIANIIIDFHQTIVSYDFVDENTICVLSKETESTTFQSLSIKDLLSTDGQIDASTLSRRSIMFSSESNHDPQSPSKVAINNSEARKMACLLDSNRRDYVIIAL